MFSWPDIAFKAEITGTITFIEKFRVI